MQKFNLSTPWANYFHELQAFFREDECVKITYDNEVPEVKIRVDGNAKAEALAQLLPSEKEFGAVTLKITIIPSNATPSRAALIRDALSGNKAFSFMETVKEAMSNPITYVVFKNKVLQYFTDNLGDIYGQRSTLYQDVAEELFGGEEGICFCTDLPEIDE